jgi:autotransporter-associated beta strand protein
MKTTLIRNYSLAVSLMLFAGMLSLRAANVIKLDTTTMNGGTADWSAAPATTDIGEFDNTATAAHLAAMTLGGSLTLGGLQLDNSTLGALTIANTGGFTLTLGTSGINMSAANNNAIFNCALALGGAQTWSVASGRTLTIQGSSLNAGANLLNISGAGNTTFSSTNALTSTGGITKTGGGTFTINGRTTANVNTIGTSTLTIDGGITSLVVPATSGTANPLNTTANVSLGGGSLTYGYSIAVSSTLASLTINPGESAIMVNRNGSFNANLTFSGTLTRNVGGTLTTRQLDTGREQVVLSSVPTDTLLTNAAGTAYLTVGNSPSTAPTPGENYADWGLVNALHQLGAVGYTSTTATSLGTAGQNANVAVATTTLAANATDASFRDAVNQVTTIDLAGHTWQTGGILVNGLALVTNGSSIKDSVGTGSLIGPAGSDLTMFISATNTGIQPFTISANIADNSGTAITKGAPGTLILSGNNTFTGGVYINDGTVQLGSAGALNLSGVNAVNFDGSGMIAGVANTSPGTVANPPTLILAGNNVSVASLSTANNLSGSTQVIKNATGSSVANATLTINGSATKTFTGTIQDGAGGGILSIIKMGSGTQTLGGTLSYSGLTTVSAGTLALTATPSATSGYVVNGTLDVSALTSGTLPLTAAQSLIGGGTVNGTVTTATGTKLAPGTGTTTTGGSGTNTMGNLTLAAGSIVNYGLSAANSNNCLFSVGAGTLALPSSGTVTINLYVPGTSTAFAAVGTYNLFQYTTGVNVSSLASRFTIGTSTTGYVPTFGTVAGPGGTTYVTLTIAMNTGVVATWNPTVDADGNWSVAGNWNPASVPHSAGDVAIFGVAGGLRTVTLDANESVGTLAMTNANSFVVANGGNILTLDNNGAGASVTVSAGTSNVIQTALVLNDNVVATVGGGDSLNVSGVVANAPSVTETVLVNGAGTTILGNANTYGPSAGAVGTTLTGGGTLQAGNNTALGGGDLYVTGSSTLQSGAAGLNIANNVAVGAGVVATVDNNGNDLTLGGVISGSGSVSKNGAGALMLSGNNTYTGGTTINAGILAVSSDGSTAGVDPGNLGLVPASAAPNNVIINGGDLLATATLVLPANRGIGIGTASGAVGTNALVDTASGQTLTVNGIIASAGNSGTNGLTINSLASTPGTVVLGAANTFNGTTVISNGVLQLANSLALQNSILNYNSGTLTFGSALTAATIGQLTGLQSLDLDSVAPAALTLTLGGNNATWTYGGSLTGLGSLTKAGTGTLTLTNISSYSGATLVNGGVLQLGTNGVINGGAANVAANGGARLVINGGSLTASASGNIGATSAGLLVSSGSAAFNGGLTMDPGSATGTIINVAGGTLTAASLQFGRSGLIDTNEPTTGDTGSGLYIHGGTVNIAGNLNMGIVSAANSSVSTRIDSGSLTVGGGLTIGLNNGGRWSVVDVNGGSLTVPDTTTGIQIGGLLAGNAVFLVRGGTATAGIINLGNAVADTVALVITNGSLYVGSGGIVQGSAATATVSLVGGILGATANWSSSVPMTLTNTVFQAADSTGASNNISLSGVISGPGNLTKTGVGILDLSGVNTYSGVTTVSNGTLQVDGSIAGGAVTVMTNATLAGGGTVSGSVTVNSGGHTLPGGFLGNATGLNTTIGGSLTFGAGAEADFNLSNTYNNGNDHIAVTGTLTGNGTNRVGISVTDLVNTNLDSTADYVLITAGSIASGFANIPVWLGGTPTNAANFSVLTVGNQVILHYSPVSISLATASPNPTPHNQLVTITVNATDGTNTIDPNNGVTVNVGAINSGSPALSLIQSNGTSIYTNSVIVSPGTGTGSQTLTVTVVDSAGNNNTATIILTIFGASEVWNGGASPNNTWGAGANWVSGVSPGNGDFVTFAGTANLTPNMETNYTVGSLTFDVTAGGFDITNGANTLTLTGGVTNNSANVQILGVPVALGGVQTVDVVSNNLVFGNTISGTGGLNVIGAGTNILVSSNSYVGSTTVNAGSTLQLGSTNALKGSALTLDSGSYLQLRGDASGVFMSPGVALQNTADTLSFDLAPETGATGQTLSLTNALNFAASTNQSITVTGNGSYTLSLGAITLTSRSHTPIFNLFVNTLPAGPGLTIASVTFGNWDDDLDLDGGGRVAVTGNLTATSNGAIDLFVNNGTTATLRGISTGNNAASDGNKYEVVNGTLVLDNNNALTNDTDGPGLNQSVFILGAATNSFSGTNYSQSAATLTATNNSYNAAVYLGDAANAAGGLTTPANLTNNVSDGDVGFTNSGVFTIGGQNTSGTNTYANPVILGWTANRGKSVTLVAATGGEVDFTGGLLKNGTDTTAGITVGDAAHGGIVKVRGANNTYGGATTVSNGTLWVSGSLAGSGAVTVDNGILLDSGTIAGAVTVSGGTLGGLGGSGTISGSATVQSGGTLMPGVNASTAGTVLTINGGLILAAGSTSIFQVSHNNVSNDQIVSVAVSYNGTLTVTTNAGDAPFAAGDTFQLFKAGIYGGSTFSTTNLPALSPGLAWSNSLAINGSIAVVSSGIVTPVAGFSGTPVSGTAPLNVVFTDASGGSITNWTWNFGDGVSVTNSSNASVNHTYGAGTYTVSLVVNGAGGSSTNTLANYIVVTPAAPVAGFSGTPTNIFVTQTVSFTDASSGSITNWVWIFGDGHSVTNSSNAGVNHAYGVVGTNTVSLIVSGPGGSGTNTQVNYIVVKSRPVLGKPVLSGNSLILSGVNGPAGQQYRILSTTNVALPLSGWTPVYTNTFNADGSYGYTNTPLTGKAGFLLLVSP